MEDEDTYVDEINGSEQMDLIAPTSDHNYFSTKDIVEVIIPDVYDDEASGDSCSSHQSSTQADSCDDKEIKEEARSRSEEDESDDDGVKGAEALLNLASRSKRGLSSSTDSSKVLVSSKKSKLSSD